MSVKLTKYGWGKHFPRSILTPEFVLGCIESCDGELSWRQRSDEFFACSHGRDVWNGRVAGKQISIRTNSNGYQFFHLCGYQIPYHHFVWLSHHGCWPSGEIDHINGVRNDNRIENLRDVCRAENSRNRAIRSDNTSGFAGVTKQKNRWRAQIIKDGKNVFLGGFATRDEAIEARRLAQSELGFTERHGQ